MTWHLDDVIIFCATLQGEWHLWRAREYYGAESPYRHLTVHSVTGVDTGIRPVFQDLMHYAVLAFNLQQEGLGVHTSSDDMSCIKLHRSKLT